MEELERKIRARLNSQQLIGRLTQESSCIEGGSSITVIADIRGGEGERLDSSFGISEKEYYVPYSGAVKRMEDFYSFDWHIDSQTQRLCVDGELHPIIKSEFLETLFQVEGQKKGKSLTDAISAQKTVFDETTGAEHTYIYELLQNANDYPYNSGVVKVQFILTEHYLFFFHTGAEFNLKNVVAICSVNQGEKKENKEAIGYKGIGFKTVFAAQNNYVFLKTGDWTFRFDEKFSTEYKNGDCAWSMMPIYTPMSDVDEECKKHIQNAAEEFRVQFALRHKKDAALNLPQLDKVFADDRILLFIPHVNSVDVYVEKNGCLTQPYSVNKGSGNWVENDYNFGVPEDLNDWVEQYINNGGRIPPKFKDISNVRISFAAAIEGNRLKKMREEDNPVVFNYLPTELNIGLSFLINADFVPNASRSGLHPVPWNDRIMTECGRYFIREWWPQFIESEFKYDLASAFDLLPDFNVVDKYAKCFENGFDDEIANTHCVPVKNGTDYRTCALSEVVWDRIGFTNSINPVLTDDEFYRFTHIDGCLPHPSIREHEHLLKLFEDYPELPQQFTTKELEILCQDDGFKSWLKVPNNNIKFNKFVIENDYISCLWNLPVFLSADGELTCAKDLYLEEIDEYVDDLSFLKSEVRRLNVEVRRELCVIPTWGNCKSHFRRFLAIPFATQILNSNSSDGAIYEYDNNIHFTHFLAKIDYPQLLPTVYAVYDESQTKRLRGTSVYFKTQEGESFLKKSWVDSSWGVFLDASYLAQDGDLVRSFLSKKLHISDLNPVVCCTNFIENERCSGYIAQRIQEESASQDFFVYLSKVRSHKVTFSDSIKRQYTLLTTDKHNDCWSPLNSLIFTQNEEWNIVAGASWMPPKVCMALSTMYYKGLSSEDAGDLKSFLQNNFIDSTGLRSLYQRVISRFSEKIFAHITTKEQSKEFLRFLYENRTSFFGDNVPDRMFRQVPILCEGNIWSNAERGKIYSHSEDLDNLCAQSWFEQSKIQVCDSYYNDLFDGVDRTNFYSNIGLLQFILRDYLLATIIPNLGQYNEKIRVRDRNLEFHRYFATIHSRFTDDECKPLRQVPIFLKSPNVEEGEIVESATDHYMPSDLLIAIIGNDLVPLKIMDSIHPDYLSGDVDADYFRNKLGNVDIDLEQFMKYIVGEDNAPIVSEYLKDKNRNIRFWRWIHNTKGITYPIKERLVVFPMLFGNNDEYAKPSELYISDKYVWDGFEDFIKEFEPDAKFVSAQYIEDGEESSEWKALFKNVKVTVDTKDLVDGTLLPNLENYSQLSVVKVLAEYTDIFKSQLNNGDEELKKKLSRLNLKGVDGYYVPSEALISGAYFGVESNPMEMIILPNLVSEDYLSDESEEEQMKIRLFLRMIAEKFNCAVETETELFSKKVAYFVRHQEDYIDLPIHYEIIGRLANNYDENRYSATIFDKEIVLRTVVGDHVKACDLYLSSIYSPNCDYIGNGIENKEFDMQFVDEKYAEYSECVGDFFVNALGVNEDFDSDNVQTLTNYDFAVYFWNVYSHSHETELVDICTEEILSSLSCIPTISGLKRPKDVYDYRTEDLCKIIQKMTRDSKTDLLPNVQFPSWLQKIGMRSKLYVNECLNYLRMEVMDYRPTVINWLSEVPIEVLKNYQKEIQNFSENVKWLNGKKEWVSLTSLVAINNGSKSLIDYFHANSSVCYTSQMPEKKEKFDTLCNEILKVKVLTDEDFSKEKECWEKDHLAIKEIEKRLLYVLYTSGDEDWENTFKGYKQKLESTDISTCKNIVYTYNDDIKTNVRIYTDSSDRLWYVGPWNGAMFGEIKEWLKREFPVLKEISGDFLNNILLDDFQTTLSNYEIELSASFSKYLDEADKVGMRIVSGNSEDTWTDEINTDAVNPMAGTNSSNPSNHQQTRHRSNQEDSNLKSSDDTNTPYSERESDEYTTTSETVSGDNTWGSDEDDYEENDTDLGLSSTGQQRERQQSGSHQHQTAGHRSSTHHQFEDGIWGESPARQEPHTYSKEDVERFKSKGRPRMLERRNAEDFEVEEINNLLDGNMTAEQIADQNYLAQLRLYKNLEAKGYTPAESKADFIRNANRKEQPLQGGKYIHKCSAAGGIMYLSPSIWNKICDNKCVVCVYLGARANDFMYFNNLDEIRDWIREDDILIKVTGAEKVDVVNDLYSNVLNGVTGTAYTMLRVLSNDTTDNMFAPINMDDDDENDDDKL